MMDTLKYLPFDTAVERIANGRSLEDGTVVVASCAAIESRQPDDKLLTIESDAGNSSWKRVWSDNIYRYELLVARNGLEDVNDGCGDVCGHKVKGTNRVCFV